MQIVGTKTRKCKKCREEKGESSFYKYTTKAGKTIRRFSCNKCVHAYQRKWKRANPEKVKAHRRATYLKWEREGQPLFRSKEYRRNWGYKTKYGITYEQFLSIAKEQNGRCKLCNTKFSSRQRKPQLDHCHATGRIRGVICKKCNQGLGQLGDTEEGLLRALEYIRSATTPLKRVK